MRLGIDFGSCFTRAAFFDGNTFVLVKGADTSASGIPSNVFVTPLNTILVGMEADKEGIRDLMHYRREIKHYISRGQPVLDQVLPEELVSHILLQLKQQADTLMRDIPRPLCSGAVVTVPADYQNDKRTLMHEAAIRAGFMAEKVTLLDEPVAVATYYDWQDKIGEGERVLIYNLGGTFSAALLQKQDGDFIYLSNPVTLERCGGIHFDQMLYASLMKEPSIKALFQAHQHSEAALLMHAQLREVCIALKQQLNTVEDAEVPITLPGTGDVIQHRLSRHDFYQMISADVAETIAACQHMLQEANITPRQIDRVLLAGGSCHIHYVQESLHTAFKHSLSITSPLELVVAQGAAIYADNHKIYIVSPQGNNGTFSTLEAALQEAEPKSRILVHPGLYQEDIELDIPIEIVGVGPRENVIVEGTWEIEVDFVGTRSHVLLQGLSLRGTSLHDEEDVQVVIAISDGKTIVENCTINVSKGCAIGIGESGQATIRYCSVVTENGIGIITTDEGRSIIEDCHIVGGGWSGDKLALSKISLEDADLPNCGLMISGEGSSAQIRRCQISNHMIEILVKEESHATIEECILRGSTPPERRAEQVAEMIGMVTDDHTEEDFFLDSCLLVEQECYVTLHHCECYHHLVGTLVAGESSMTVGDCRMHSCLLEAMIFEKSSVEFERCTFYEHVIGILVGGKSRSIVKHCNIADSEGAGIQIVGEDSSTDMVDCEVYDGKSIGIQTVQGRGTIENSRFYRNGGPSIKIQGGTIEMKDCHIHKGKYVGISITEKGEGRLKNTTLAGSTGIGVRVNGPQSKAIMSRCTFKGTNGIGAVIEDTAEATFWFCQFDENSLEMYVELGSHATKND